MREASIILPLRDNAGAKVEAAHKALQEALIASFGGFSHRPVWGAWQDGGTVYRDRSREYTVAADWNPALRVRLKRLARMAGVKARQVAMYVRDDTGEAHILPTYTQGA